MKKLATLLVLLSLGMFSFGCSGGDDDVTPTTSTDTMEATDDVTDSDATDDVDVDGADAAADDAADGENN